MVNKATQPMFVILDDEDNYRKSDPQKNFNKSSEMLAKLTV